MKGRPYLSGDWLRSQGPEIDLDNFHHRLAVLGAQNLPHTEANELLERRSEEAQ